MIAKFPNGIIAVTGLLLLGACESAMQAQTGQTAPSGDRVVSYAGAASGIASTKLVAHPEDARPGTSRSPVEGNVVLSNRNQLKTTLRGYGSIRNGNLRQIIDDIESKNLDQTQSVPGLTGVGGIFGHALIDLAKGATANNGNYNNGVRVVVDLSGQITDYNYDASTGSGAIQSITYVTMRRVTPTGTTLPNAESIAYKFTVEVDDGGFTDIPHSGDRDDPFPGTTLAFGPDTLHRIETLGFNRKLWAQGDAIDVTEVWVDENYQPGEQPNFGNPVDQNDPEYERLFDTDADSCIDMMFNVPQGGALPSEMAELDAPPFYCLGRCADPLLINTK